MSVFGFESVAMHLRRVGTPSTTCNISRLPSFVIFTFFPTGVMSTVFGGVMISSIPTLDIMLEIYSKGYIDVGDGCWIPNVLVTILRCW